MTTRLQVQFLITLLQYCIIALCSFDALQFFDSGKNLKKKSWNFNPTKECYEYCAASDDPKIDVTLVYSRYDNQTKTLESHKCNE